MSYRNCCDLTRLALHLLGSSRPLTWAATAVYCFSPHYSYISLSTLAGNFLG